jgi:integrase
MPFSTFDRPNLFGVEHSVYTELRRKRYSSRRAWWDGAAEAAGLEGLTPHEMRHTAASLAVSHGASVLELQRMLGHDKPSTTLDFYADLFDDDLDEVASKLDAACMGFAAAYSLRTVAGSATASEDKKS